MLSTRNHLDRFRSIWIWKHVIMQGNIYLFKGSNINYREMCKICRKFSIIISERRQWCRSGVLWLTLNIFYTFFLCGYYWLREYIKNICDALLNLVPFVQFKNHEQRPWRSVTFSKVAGWSSTPPCNKVKLRLKQRFSCF